jgi:hypothetical protein
MSFRQWLSLRQHRRGWCLLGRHPGAVRGFALQLTHRARLTADGRCRCDRAAEATASTLQLVAQPLNLLAYPARTRRRAIAAFAWHCADDDRPPCSAESSSSSPTDAKPKEHDVLLPVNRFPQGSVCRVCAAAGCVRLPSACSSEQLALHGRGEAARHVHLADTPVRPIRPLLSYCLGGWLAASYPPRRRDVSYASRCPPAPAPAGSLAAWWAPHLARSRPSDRGHTSRSRV